MKKTKEEEGRMMNLESRLFRSKYHFLAVVSLISLILIIAAFLLSDNNRIPEVVVTAESYEARNATGEEDPVSVPACDFFSGRWVLDVDSSYPLYRERNCSFMIPDYACEEYGRKDFKYQKWKWQPHGCNLPRFNGTELLEKLRGKSLIFVGDSLNKNQWLSFLCLIESSLPESSSKSVIRTENLYTFRSNEYNATIGFYWSPLLVESNCDNPEDHRVKDRIIRINSIEKHARHWTDADFLVFDSYGWWLDPTMTILWGSFGSQEAIYKKVAMKHRIYEMVLDTWAQWLEINIDANKTRLFFMSLSPVHFFGETWDDVQNCYNVSEPIEKSDYWGVFTDKQFMRTAESIVGKLEERGLRIEYLNITHMSDYRRDAHNSIYRWFHHPPSEEQRADPRGYADCAHWCLPGVPDVWNQILYSYMIVSNTSS